MHKLRAAGLVNSRALPLPQRFAGSATKGKSLCIDLVHWLCIEKNQNQCTQKRRILKWQHSQKKVQTEAQNEVQNEVQNDTEQQLKSFHIEQRLKGDYFVGWNDDELKAVDCEDIRLIGEIFKARLENNGIKAKEFYIVCHDGDVKQLYYEGHEDTPTIVCKRDHIHLYGRLNKRVRLSQLANIIGLRKSQIEIPKHGGAGGYFRENTLTYLLCSYRRVRFGQISHRQEIY
jgi:hypothetical protein